MGQTWSGWGGWWKKYRDSAWREYFRTYITGPLGMDRTWFNLPDSLKPFVVSRGRRGDDGQQTLVEMPDRIPLNKVVQYNGGGGLYSTPEDYTRLLQCLLNDGVYGKFRLLKKKSIELKRKNQVGDISLEPSGRYFIPGSCCDFNGLMDEQTKWGYGWMSDMNDQPYGPRAGTVSWGGALNTYFYIDFKSGVAADIYTQHFPFNHPQTTDLFKKFSSLLYFKEFTILKK